MWNQIEIVYFVSNFCFTVLHTYICDATCQNQAHFHRSISCNKTEEKVKLIAPK